MRKSKPAILAAVFLAVILGAVYYFRFARNWADEKAGEHQEQGGTVSSEPQASADDHSLPNSSYIERTRSRLAGANPIIADKLKGAPGHEESLSKKHDALAVRARAGDAQAARELQSDTLRCKHVADSLRLADRVLGLPDKYQGPTTQISNMDAMLNMVQDDLTYASASMPICDGVTDAQLQELPEWTLDAAKAGDPNASQCLVGMGLDSMGNIFSAPQWLNDYKSSVLDVANNSVANGDWHVVGLLENAYAGDLDTFLIGHVVQPNPADQYRYLKLQTLGAGAEATAQNNLQARLSQLQQQLSPSDISAGDAWASQTYARSFSGKPSDDTLNSNSFCNQPQ